MKKPTGFALALMMTPLATLAETAEERAERCAAQGELWAQAADMRLERRSEKKAKAALLEAVSEKMKASVPIIVGYVYTLNRKDIKGTDLRASFVEQCNSAVID